MVAEQLDIVTELKNQATEQKVLAVSKIREAVTHRRNNHLFRADLALAEAHKHRDEYDKIINTLEGRRIMQITIEVPENDIPDILAKYGAIKLKGTNDKVLKVQSNPRSKVVHKNEAFTLVDKAIRDLHAESPYECYDTSELIANLGVSYGKSAVAVHMAGFDRRFVRFKRADREDIYWTTRDRDLPDCFTVVPTRKWVM